MGVESPVQIDSSPVSREQRRELFKRNISRFPIYLLVIAICAAMNGILLVTLREIVRPTTPPGGWVIEPPPVALIATSVYGAAFTSLLPMGFISRHWKQKDLERGLPALQGPHYSTVRRVVIWSVLALIGFFILAGAIQYCNDFIVIAPDSVRLNVKFTNRTYAMHLLRKITIVPQGYRIDSIAADGPFATMYLDGGVEKAFGKTNQLSNADVQAICAFLAENSGITVEVDPEATRVRP